MRLLPFERGEWRRFATLMRPHLRRAWRALTLRPEAGDRVDHAIANLYVEASRSSPRVAGHLHLYKDGLGALAFAVVLLALQCCTGATPR